MIEFYNCESNATLALDLDLIIIEAKKLTVAVLICLKIVFNEAASKLDVDCCTGQNVPVTWTRLEERDKAKYCFNFGLES